MSPTTPSIQRFFDEWERIINASDDDRIASCYADAFLFADPSGVRPVHRQQFVAALPRRREFFKTLGHTSTKITSLHETALDDHYAMVRARLLMVFEKPTIRCVKLEIDSTFILRVLDDGPKIVFHLEHETLQQVLQARGLIGRE